MRKGIILADEQIPHQIRLDPVNAYIADFQPDIVCRLGDMLDMEALQGWNHKKPAQIDWEEIRNEIRIANEILDRQDSLHKAKEKHFWMGNHEERLKYFREQHIEYWRKNFSTMPYLVRDLKFKERGYKVHGQNDTVPFGKLHMFHGNDWSTHHARKNLSDYEVNLVYGHVHSPQRYTKVSRVSASPKSAWSVGCLCSRNPAWKNKAPNAWVNGFAIFYLHDDGNFNLYTIDIIKGRFYSPEGKLYK